ncbi:hypothetical protein D3C72_2091200 [compost metagenome]
MRRPPVMASTSPCTDWSRLARADFSLSSSAFGRRSQPVTPCFTQRRPAGPPDPPCTRPEIKFSASSAWSRIWFVPRSRTLV